MSGNRCLNTCRAGFVLVAGVLATSPPAAGAIYTVGADGSCTHATLAPALLSAAFNDGPDEIRIATNQTYNNQYLHLTDWSPATAGAVTLRGGFDNCADTTEDGWTVLNGGSGNPVIEVDTSSQTVSAVTLRHLELTGSGVKGLLVEGGGDVALQATKVTLNDGGGIMVVDGASASLDSATDVTHNSGTGITCLTGSTVTSAAYIALNNAATGGGLLAGSGCIAEILPSGWISGNDASFGGGLFASSGAQVTIQGVSGVEKAWISFNEATDQGGGIYAVGAGTTVTLENASVTGNVAGDEGGGIYAFDDAVVTMDRVDFDCFDPARCSQLSSNHLSAGSSGVGVFAGGGADVTLYQTYVESNSPTGASVVGSVVHADGAGSTVRLEGVAFSNNSAVDALLAGENGAAIEAAFVSASGHYYTSGIAAPIELASGATGRLYSSIYWPNGPVSTTGGASLLEVDCLILSDTTGLPGSASLVSSVDPQFFNAAAGNLHVPLGSPAVDYCDTFYYEPTQADADFELRGFDRPENANGSPGVSGGTFDIGYDEVWPLFADGFESGTTSAWSSSVP